MSDDTARKRTNTPTTSSATSTDCRRHPHASHSSSSRGASANSSGGGSHWPLVFALTSAVFVIIALPAYLISAYQTPPRQPDPQAIAERLQKVGSVALSVAVATDRPVATGEEVYKKQCSICHAAGTLGAPKFEDAAAWAPRLGQGYDALVQSSLRGKNNMPAQGGAAFSDYEIARAVAYMANAAGAQFEEPPPPQGAASDVPAANNADAAASDADATDGVDSANDAAAATDEAAAAP